MGKEAVGKLPDIKPDEVRDSLRDLGLQVSVELLSSPTPDLVETLYRDLLEKALDVDPDALGSPLTTALANTEYAVRART